MLVCGVREEAMDVDGGHVLSWAELYSSGRPKRLELYSSNAEKRRWTNIRLDFSNTLSIKAVLSHCRSGPQRQQVIVLCPLLPP